MPRLTVFTTFHENSGYLDETIASVLSQSYADFEYLLLNDGDPAESERIAAKFHDPRLRLVDTEPLGRTRARQRGLELVRTEYIALIDSDDVCEPERFARQMDFLSQHPDHVLVGTALRYIDERSRTIGHRAYPTEDAEIKRTLLVYNCIAHPSVIARNETLLAAGGYDVAFDFAEDYDLLLRAARFGKFHNLAEPLVAYRVHLKSGKNLHLKKAVRDTLRLKLHAIRRYGYRLTPAVALSIALHAALLPLPAWVIWRAFHFAIVRRSAAATTASTTT